MKTKKIDYSQDLKTLKKFTDKFEKNYFKQLGLKVYQEAFPMEHIRHGAIKIYSTLNRVPKNFVTTKYVKDVNSTLFYLSSGINPNGVTGANDIARTFTLKFEVTCQSRNKWGRDWFEDTLIRFYGYGRTIEEITDKFNSFVESNEFQKLYIK
jgi:hypothetical protein